VVTLFQIFSQPGQKCPGLLCLITLALLLVSPGCSEGESSAGLQGEEGQSAHPVFRTISPAEAAAMIEARDDLLVIDVRTEPERQQVRIAETDFVPVGDVIRGVFRAEPDRPIMLLCAVGGRSYIAGKVLIGRGYREVYNLDGGIEAWRRAGFAVLSGPEERQELSN
jgi:rhodanese-related sulfurtransferase